MGNYKIIILSLFLITSTSCMNQDNNTKKQSELKIDSNKVINNDNTPLSFKGYELYTWKDGDKQLFSLLIGTNRDKMPEEIKAEAVDFNSIISKISKLSKGENIILFFAGKYPSLPPAELTKEMKTELTNLCNSKGINLNLK